MLENFFTLPKDEFGKLLLSQIPTNTIQNKPQAYRYTRVRLLKCAMEAGPLISLLQSNSFVMRSQLDCVDHRLPGSGVFDIKTRAALPIRLDNLNFKARQTFIPQMTALTEESFRRRILGI